MVEEITPAEMLLTHIKDYFILEGDKLIGVGTQEYTSILSGGSLIKIYETPYIIKPNSYSDISLECRSLDPIYVLKGDKNV
mgnify:CR=1 FL=1